MQISFWVIRRDGTREETYEINGQRLLIGRHSREFPTPDEISSRQHAALYATSQGEIYIHDLGSRNGTFVNGTSVTCVRLSPGDEVRVGRTVFRVASIGQQREPAEALRFWADVTRYPALL